jgi:hypothetical protein
MRPHIVKLLGIFHNKTEITFDSKVLRAFCFLILQFDVLTTSRYEDGGMLLLTGIYPIRGTFSTVEVLLRRLGQPADLWFYSIYAYLENHRQTLLAMKKDLFLSLPDVEFAGITWAAALARLQTEQYSVSAEVSNTYATPTMRRQNNRDDICPLVSGYIGQFSGWLLLLDISGFLVLTFVFSLEAYPGLAG